MILKQHYFIVVYTNETVICHFKMAAGITIKTMGKTSTVFSQRYINFHTTQSQKYQLNTIAYLVACFTEIRVETDAGICSKSQIKI